MKITDVNMDAVAMDGLDPVAYANGESLTGKSEFSYSLNGEKFVFSNRKNLERFMENPENFIPKVGGHTFGITHSQAGDAFVGRKTFLDREDLADVPIKTKKDIPTETEENESVEMQNLSGL